VRQQLLDEITAQITLIASDGPIVKMPKRVLQSATARTRQIGLRVLNPSFPPTSPYLLGHSAQNVLVDALRNSSVMRCLRSADRRIRMGNPIYDDPAAEELEIIRLVEQSSFSVLPTLAQVGIQRSTFYCWV